MYSNTINETKKHTPLSLKQDIENILEGERQIVLSRRSALIEDGKLNIDNDLRYRNGFFVSSMVEEYDQSRSQIFRKAREIYESNKADEDKLNELYDLYLFTQFDIQSKIAGRSGAYDKGKETDYTLSDEEIEANKDNIENKFDTTKDNAIRSPLLRENNKRRVNRDERKVRFNEKEIKAEKSKLLKERKSNEFYANKFMIENRKDYFIYKQKGSFMQRAFDFIFKKTKQNKPLKRSVYL